MTSIYQQPNGGYSIQFHRTNKWRRTLRLGAIKPKVVEMVKLRIEQIHASQKPGVAFDTELTQ